MFIITWLPPYGVDDISALIGNNFTTERMLCREHMNIHYDGRTKLRWKSRVEVQRRNRTEIIGLFYIHAMISDHKIDNVGLLITFCRTKGSILSLGKSSIIFRWESGQTIKIWHSNDFPKNCPWFLLTWLLLTNAMRIRQITRGLRRAMSGKKRCQSWNLHKVRNKEFPFCQTKSQRGEKLGERTL